LLYTGGMIDAEEALRLGYVLDVLPSDELLPAAMSLARTIAAGSPHSLGLIKSLVHEGLTAPVEEHMERHTSALVACFKSDDHREGVASFLERRPARFTGT
jgi:enoyl-CoA hydratase